MSTTKKPATFAQSLPLLSGHRNEAQRTPTGTDNASSPQRKQTHIPYAVAYLTGACNLGCRYCFANRMEPRHMSVETGRKVVRWMFEDNAGSDNDDPLILAFFGGEPLLRFDVMQEIVKYSKELASEYGRQMLYSVTTNGTLITEEILDFFDEHKIGILFSIDGDRETHDRNRTFKDGSSSAEITYRNAQAALARFPRTAARMTVDRDAIGSIMHNIKFLHELGFRLISPCPVTESIHDSEAWEQFDHQCRLAAEYAIGRILENDALHIHFLDKCAELIIKGKAFDSACGAGKTFVGIDVDGNIYPCHRFVSYAAMGSKSFRIGTIRDGIDPLKSLPFWRYNRRSFLGCYTKCPKCPARNICLGGCIALNHEITGNFLLPPVQQQRLMTIWHQISTETIDCFKRMGKYELFLKHIGERAETFPSLHD